MGNTLSAAVTTDSEDAALIARFRPIAPQLADALEATGAALREERQNSEGLRDRLAEANAWVAVYREAADHSAMERDAAEARATAAEERLAEAEKLAAVRDIALGRLREMADECEAANAPPGGQQVRLRRMTVTPSIIKELRHIADEGNATWTYDEVRKVESRAKAAEERVLELEKALEALADMSLNGACCASHDEVWAARRALRRPE